MQVKRSALTLLAAVAFALTSTVASEASVITFEGVAPAGVQFAVGNNYAEVGFNFHNPGLPSDAAIIGQPSQNTSGTDYYTWNSPPTNNPVTLTNMLGYNFDLSSLDVGSKSGIGLANFSITGYLSGGGTVVHNVIGENDFQPLALGWTSLSKVEFRFGSGDFGAIDNLAVQAPEPASMSLLGMGLVGAIVARRRRQRVS